MKTASEAASFLLARDRFLLLTHRNPDGDTSGSAAALCRGLRSLGKAAYLYPNPQITDTYLSFARPYFAPADYIPACTVSLDIADGRIFPDGYDGVPELCIDHHASNTRFAAETYLLPEKASCGEVVLGVLRAMGVTPDPVTAGLLYTALATDCGCFQYRNTTADTHRAAAELMELGADTATLNKQLFRTFSRARLALEGMAYTGMRQYLDGKLNVVTFTLEMLARAGAQERDCDDLASLAGKLEGVEVSMTLRELPGRQT